MLTGDARRASGVVTTDRWWGQRSSQRELSPCYRVNLRKYVLPLGDKSDFFTSPQSALPQKTKERAPSPARR